MDVASPSPSGAAAWRWLVAPAAFGLAIRAVAVFAYERSILGACLGLDPEGHFEAAARISQGAWGEGHSLFSGGLLYPNFLALVFRVFGIGTLAPRVVQALIGTSTVALVGALGERLLSRRAGLIAAYACSLSAPLLLSELGFESEFLATFAAAAALFVLARDRARPFSYFVGGALLGACALTRPNLVLVSGFVAIWLAACVRPLKAAVTCVAVLSTGAALVILPFAAHDDRLGAQGGYVFYVGHHPGASYHVDWLSFGDNSADGEFLAAWSEANRRAGRALTPAQASSYWFAEGLRSIAQDPERLARNSFARLRAFLCDYELPDNYDLAFVREQVPLLRFLFVSFGLALPFAALGVLRTTRRSALLLAVPFATLATVLVFYFNARFRVPALPFVLVFAADGLLFLVELVRARSTVALLRAAPVAVLAGAAAFWPPQERFDFYYSYILVGTRPAGGRRARRALEAPHGARGSRPGGADRRAGVLRPGGAGRARRDRIDAGARERCHRPPRGGREAPARPRRRADPARRPLREVGPDRRRPGSVPPCPRGGPELPRGERQCWNFGTRARRAAGGSIVVRARPGTYADEGRTPHGLRCGTASRRPRARADA